jgi:formylglycine-generating enzyme required for sulfatase activity
MRGTAPGLIVMLLATFASLGGAKENLVENSLGMRLVPLPGTTHRIAIWETRVKDYARFFAEEGGPDRSWQGARHLDIVVSPTDDCPVVNVSWNEAQQFCAWLSKQEGRTYRLPTDAEWQLAFAAGSDAGPTAPWPPRVVYGNFGDAAARRQIPGFVALEDYDDGFAATSPVGSFPPNGIGLHDLTGNVWEWVDASPSPFTRTHRVIRGGSWLDFLRIDLVSPSRARSLPGLRFPNVGFRVLLVG